MTTDTPAVKFSLYYYKAKVVRVIDGDSIIVDIDLGMNMFINNRRVRLASIDTPEIRGPEREQGLISKDWLVEKIDGQEVILKTEKDISGRYGRLVATIFKDGVNLNEQLINEGLAEYVSY